MNQEQEEPVLELTDWLNTWRNAQGTPPPLFHYTDADGLRGIINSGSLWATHIDYLNDSQEFKHAYGLINSIIDGLLGGEQNQTTVRLRLIKDWFQRHFILWRAVLAPYVVCFCEKGNLLSQWRAYAADGSGFSLEFDPGRLMQGLSSNGPDVFPNIKLFKAVYDESEQKRLILLALEQLLAAFDSHRQEDVLGWVPLVFSEMNVCFKHPAFAEEQEWRLVYMARGAEHLVNVRVSHDRLLPFASLPFCAQNERPPYTSIGYGPTLDPRNTKRAIEMLIGKANPYWNTVDVVGSDAPFRSR
jgi:hypothetical protein